MFFKGVLVIKYSLAKIAKELGVSKSTVSFVLNGKASTARISADMEKRILDFCKEVNYVPNIHAQRINRKFAGNIGFLVKQSVLVDIDNPFADYNISSIMGGIVLTAESYGCRVSVQLYNENMDENRVFDWLRSNEIDSLIYYGVEMPARWKKIFAEEKRCVAGIGIMPDKNISSVNIDNFSASYDLTKILIGKGRTKFLYISGNDGSFVSDERKNGFYSACKENGIDVSNIEFITAYYSESKAREIVSNYNTNNIDAIVCANDDMALGALKALREKGISVPEKIAVVGGDNIVLGRYFSPSLTTFDNMQYELGKAAVECVVDMSNGEREKTIIIPTKVILRESL